MSGRFVVLVLKNAGLAVAPFLIVVFLLLASLVNDLINLHYEDYRWIWLKFLSFSSVGWGLLFGIFNDEFPIKARNLLLYKIVSYWIYFFSSIFIYFLYWNFKEKCENQHNVYDGYDYVVYCDGSYFSIAFTCQVFLFFVTLGSARRHLERAYNAT